MGEGTVQSVPEMWWSVAAILLGSFCSCQALNDDADNASSPPAARAALTDNDEYLLKQVVWKRCYRKLTPSCLKLNLVRTVELMSRDSSFFVVPGVFFSSNSSEPDPLPPDIARSLTSDMAPLDDLVTFTLSKYLRTLTLNVNLVDFLSGGNETLQNSVVDIFSGRAKKDGFGGYGAIAAMMGGMMASMMMAALAALAGKAMMTSLLALMMAAFAAMKGGGGGGDSDSKTYEVITKPMVSHINTHSSEVQHHDHGHYKRSLNHEESSSGGKLKNPQVDEETVDSWIEEVGKEWKSDEVSNEKSDDLHGTSFSNTPQLDHGHYKRSLKPDAAAKAVLEKGDPWLVKSAKDLPFITNVKHNDDILNNRQQSSNAQQQDHENMKEDLDDHDNSQINQNPKIFKKESDPTVAENINEKKLFKFNNDKSHYPEEERLIEDQTQRQKRSIGPTDIRESKTSKGSQPPKDENNLPQMGHPRQNHRKY